MEKKELGSNSSLRKGGKRKVAWFALLIVVTAVLIAVALPVWIIQPFRPQSARGLQVAFLLRDWSPLLSLIGLSAVLLLTIFLWKGTRRWLRPALIVAFAITAAAAWFARQNHFEWMFNPIQNPGFAIVEDANFVDDKDYVISVEVNGEPAAYPVRQLAYHHLVHDVVGGVPIVTTY